jgi:hypothetical protein
LTPSLSKRRQACGQITTVPAHFRHQKSRGYANLMTFVTHFDQSKRFSAAGMPIAEYSAE